MAQARVTPFIPRPRVFDSREAVMDLIRAELYAYPMDYASLAREIGIREGTLYAVRSGRTKWPQPHTFFGLVKALGLEVQLRKREV